MSIFKAETKKQTGNEPAQAAIASVLDDAILKRQASQEKRDYLGASRWGEACERRLRYEYEHTPEDEGSGFSPEVLRIFDMGHDGEARMADYIREAGFDLLTEKSDGKQFGFRAADGRLGGHIDGIVAGGPIITGVEYPLLWENKALNDRSWNDTKNKGVKVSKPVYYAQMQIYCAYLDIPSGGMFTALNRDTGEVLVELVPYDALAAQEASDRAVRVIDAQSPKELPRLGNDRTDFRCKFCSFKSTCWEDVPVQVSPKATKPFWLK
jgi:hypothetical protein